MAQTCFPDAVIDETVMKTNFVSVLLKTTIVGGHQIGNGLYLQT